MYEKDNDDAGYSLTESRQDKKTKIIDVVTSGECEDCAGGIYPEGKAPKLPIHPNCGCDVYQIEVSVNASDEEIENKLQQHKDIIIKAVDRIRKNEGFSKHPYLDIRGNFTVGNGQNIENIEQAQKVPFKDGSFKTLSKSEIKDNLLEMKQLRDENLSEYKQVFHNQDYNRSAKFQSKDPNFAVFKKMQITEDDALTLLEKRIRKVDIPQIRKDFGRVGVDTANLPPSVYVALIDMEYNLGANKFNPKTFPKLTEALKEGDYLKAARESQRKGISKPRNEDTRRLFEEGYAEKYKMENYGRLP